MSENIPVCDRHSKKSYLAACVKISSPGCHTCPKAGHKIIGGVCGGGHDHASVMMRRLRNRDRKALTNHEGESDRIGDLVASFPSFCAWILELQPGASQEEIQRIAERLKPILVRQLRKSTQWRQVEAADIMDCQYDVLMFLEKRLREPMEFVVKVLRMGTEYLQFELPHVKVMHLFRAEPFAIIAHHSDFRPSRRFRASLRILRLAAKSLRPPVCHAGKADASRFVWLMKRCGMNKSPYWNCWPKRRSPSGIIPA
jgi:hypothetical protein